MFKCAVAINKSMRDGAEHNRKIDARHFLPAAERCPFLITNRDEEASGDGKMYYLHCDITFFFCGAGRKLRAHKKKYIKARNLERKSPARGD